MIDFDLNVDRNLGKAVIKVIGVGGAGGNTINSMIDNGGWGDIEFIVANTDSQALALSKATHKVQLGIKSTKGLGTGANPEVGRRAAEEDLDKLLEVVGGADIVFLAAGMGGGTGSGASPVIAKALRERNILTIAVVTKPFIFEGRRRARVAYDALQALRAEVDTLLIVPNQKLLEVADAGVSMIDAFALVNEVLDQSVRGISNIIIKPGHINVDFADLRTIMCDMGLAVMGTGKSTGLERARQATLSAINSPLLENMSIKGAKGVLLNITGGKNLGLHEINEAASVIYEQADEDANIILGSVIDETLTDEIVVTIVATGFDEQVQLAASKGVVEAIPVSVQAPPVQSIAPVVLKAEPVATPVQDVQEVVAARVEPGVAKAMPDFANARPVQVLSSVAQSVQAVEVKVEPVIAKVEPAIETAPVIAQATVVAPEISKLEPAQVSQVVHVAPVVAQPVQVQAQTPAVPAQVAPKVVSLQQIVQQAPVKVAVKAEAMDVNDLDVPTFLREKAKAEQSDAQ